MLGMVLSILASIIFPVFVLIGIGWLLDRRFRLDVPTLSKLNFYVFVPALIFVKVLDSDIRLTDARDIVLVSVLLVAALYGLTRVVYRFAPFRDAATALTLGTLFFNAGNYGLPLAELAYPGVGAGIMAIVLMTQNLLCFTLGLWILESRSRTPGAILLGLVRIPVVPAIAAALSLRGIELQPPAVVMVPLRYLADGLIPVALLTLGVQLGRTTRSETALPLAGVGLARLVISPLIAWGLVWLVGMSGPAAGVCIVAGGLPVAVNVYILASEYRQHAALASRMVFWTTLLSAASLTVVLALVKA